MSHKLSKKLVRSPAFRWMRGMQPWVVNPHRSYRICTNKDAKHAKLMGRIPDLNDPATVGCLLALYCERVARGPKHSPDAIKAVRVFVESPGEDIARALINEGANHETL